MLISHFNYFSLGKVVPTLDRPFEFNTKKNGPLQSMSFAVVF